MVLCSRTKAQYACVVRPWASSVPGDLLANHRTTGEIPRTTDKLTWVRRLKRRAKHRHASPTAMVVADTEPP